MVPDDVTSGRLVIFGDNPGVKVLIDDITVGTDKVLPKMTNRLVKIMYGPLVFDPDAGTSGGLYLGTGWGTTSLGGVWRSLDGGDNWDFLMAGGRVRTQRRGDRVLPGFDVTSLDVQTIPNEPTVVTVGTLDQLYRSIGGDGSYENVCSDSLGVATFASRGDIQPDVVIDVVELTGDPSILVFGDADTGFNSSRDSGATWDVLGTDYWANDGIPVPNWYGPVSEGGLGMEVDAPMWFLQDPDSANHLYFGVWHRPRYNPNATPDGFGGIVHAVFDPVGEEWSFSELGTPTSPSPRGGPVSLVMNPNNREFYAAVTGQGVFTFDGQDWTQIGFDPEPNKMMVTRLVFDSQQALYAAVGDDVSNFVVAPTHEAGLWRLAPADTAFRKQYITNPDTLGLDALVVLDVASESPGSLLVALGPPDWRDDIGEVGLDGNRLFQANIQASAGGLYRLESLGAPNWKATKLLAQPWITSILTDSSRVERIYAVSPTLNGPGDDNRAGIYVTEDAGKTWSRLPNNGLSNLRDSWMKRSSLTPGLFYVGTTGNGLFRGRLYPPPAPTSLVVADVKIDSVRIEWDPPGVGAFGHYVLRRASGETAWVTYDSLGANTAYVDRSVQGVCGYDYAVQAFNESGRSAESNAAAVGLPPQVTAVSPYYGIRYGGTSVTITGSGFIVGASVAFDGVSATNVTVVDCNTITCTTPAHAPATVDVQVTNPAGGGSATLPNSFIYTARPGDPPPPPQG